MARTHVQGYLRQLHLVDDLSKSICLLIELALEEETEDARQRVIEAQQLSCQALQRIQKNLSLVTNDLLTSRLKDGH